MSSIEELEEMIRHIQTRLVFLEGRVAQLESGKYPYTPPYNPIPINYPYTYEKPKCRKCGMDLSNVMGYVCAAIDCPTFPKITCSVPGTVTGSCNTVTTGTANLRRNGDYDIDGNWVSDRSR